jgi:hypothetical protein
MLSVYKKPKYPSHQKLVVIYLTENTPETQPSENAVGKWTIWNYYINYMRSLNACAVHYSWKSLIWKHLLKEHFERLVTVMFRIGTVRSEVLTAVKMQILG